MPKLAALASFLFTRLSRWLVRHNGARYVLAGTFALAGLSAYAANRPSSSTAKVMSTSSTASVTERHYEHHGWHHHYRGYAGYGDYRHTGGVWTRHTESPNNNYDYYVGHGSDLSSGTPTQ